MVGWVQLEHTKKASEISDFLATTGKTDAMRMYLFFYTQPIICITGRPTAVDVLMLHLHCNI